MEAVQKVSTAGESHEKSTEALKPLKDKPNPTTNTSMYTKVEFFIALSGSEISRNVVI